jgi:hypothetical protein
MELDRHPAYLTIARIGGDPDRLLDGYRSTSAVMDHVGHDHGLILHAAAPTTEGLLIVNVWPSKDGSEAAAADPRRLAALAHVGLSQQQHRKEHHELERYVVFGGRVGVSSIDPCSDGSEASAASARSANRAARSRSATS